MKKIPAIIPARGGSKRLPRKNVLPFCGQPLIAWAIVQAKYCKYIDDVWVTTDDDEIADIAEQWGARIIHRPDWPDADILSAYKPVLHAVQEIRDEYDFDIYSTSLVTDPCWHLWDYDRLFERYFELEKKNPNIRKVSSYCKKREINIYRILSNDYVIPVVASKDYEYVSMGPSKGVFATRKHLAMAKESLKAGEMFIHDTIQGFDQHRGFLKEAVKYYLCDWYQGTSIDDQDTFELNEIFMERYVLKGRGIEIYKEYAEQRDGKEEKNTSNNLR